MLLTLAEYNATQDKISKLNVRAIKRGWTGTLAVTGVQVTETRTLPNGLEVTEQFIDTEITGTPPCYGGYTFLAKAEWDADSGLVIYSAPGAPIINRDSLTDGACDHCKINRYRKHIFIIADENGNQIQVGSTCLKDFLGWNVNPVWIDESDTDKLFETGGSHTEPTYSTETVLAAAWATIQEFGFQRADSMNPTKSTVMNVLSPGRSKEAQAVSAQVAPHIPGAMAQAKVIREWVLSDAFSGDSDYVINLKNIAAGEFVSYRKFGFLVSAPQAWAKSMERSLIRKQETEGMLNEWNGQPGDKLEITVTLTSIRYIDSYYGVSDLYTFADADGRIYKWFSSRHVFSDTDGKPVTIKGTVKKLEEYRGKKSTMLTRCKVVD